MYAQAAAGVLVDPDDPGRGGVRIRVGLASGPVTATVLGTRCPKCVAGTRFILLLLLYYFYYRCFYYLLSMLHPPGWGRAAPSALRGTHFGQLHCVMLS